MRNLLETLRWKRLDLRLQRDPILNIEAIPLLSLFYSTEKQYSDAMLKSYSWSIESCSTIARVFSETMVEAVRPVHTRKLEFENRDESII